MSDQIAVPDDTLQPYETLSSGPSLDSGPMEMDIIDGCCFKLLNCSNLWCSNRKLIPHDFNYHQMTHKFMSSKTFSCISNSIFYIFSWLSQRYFNFSVPNTRLRFITLKPSSVNSIYHASSWEARNLGLVCDTFSSFISYIQSIKNFSLFHFFVASTSVWFTQHLLHRH